MSQLKGARKQHKIRQHELAKRLGVTQSMIAHWESGRYPLSDDWKLKIQQAIIEILRERARNAKAQLKKLEKEKP